MRKKKLKLKFRKFSSNVVWIEERFFRKIIIVIVVVLEYIFYRFGIVNIRIFYFVIEVRGVVLVFWFGMCVLELVRKWEILCFLLFFLFKGS